MKGSQYCRQNHERGFSMVEILVALLIVLTSIMGVASLLTRTVQQEVESSQRVEAMVLLQDMVDRINSNRQVADCYSDGADGLTVGSGFSPADLPACAVGTNANQQDRAETDLLGWDQLLKGVAVQAGNSNVGAMIGARGCIDRDPADDRSYRVTVAWQGMNPTFAPANNDCAENLYGDDALRRVVTAIVRIGNLQ